MLMYILCHYLPKNISKFLILQNENDARGIVIDDIFNSI